MAGQQPSDPLVMLKMLERGQLHCDLQNEISELIKCLKEEAGPKGKAKGSLTLKLNFAVSGAFVTVGGDIKVKKPATAREETTLFVTNSGELSIEHPSQLNMFPRVIDADDDRAAG